MPKRGPQPKPREKVRTEMISFPDTTANKADYKDAAEECGVSLAEWIRSTLAKALNRKAATAEKKSK